MILVSVIKQTIENDFGVSMISKYPLGTVVSEPIVTLAKPLRLQILYFYMEDIVRWSALVSFCHKIKTLRSDGDGTQDP